MKLLESKISFTQEEIVELCGQSGKHAQSVKDCVSSAWSPNLASLPSFKTYVNNKMISKVCSPLSCDMDQRLGLQLSSNSSLSGSCLVNIVSLSTSNMNFVDIDDKAVVNLCRYYPERSQSIMKCLKRRHPYKSTKLTWQEVKSCESVRAETTAVRVIRAVGKYGEPFITAGEIYSITFQLLDQYDREVVLPSSSGSSGGEQEVWLSCTVQNDLETEGENHDFDAVIWDHKPARASVNGTVLVTLAISKPGNIRLVVTAYCKSIPQKSSITSDNTHDNDNDNAPPVTETRRVVLGIFKLQVRENPQLKYETNCLFMFYRGTCTNESEYSETVSNLITTNMYTIQSCLHTWLGWGVTPTIGYTTPAAVSASDVSTVGSSTQSQQQSTNTNQLYLLTYRRGVDSIWTGHGLPTESMTSQQVLGLPVHFPDFNQQQHQQEPTSQSRGSSNIKHIYKANERLLKKAYYEVSKLWHPDRWSGMASKHSNYLSIVQTAFYYVHLAYESLTAELEQYKQQGVGRV